LLNIWDAGSAKAVDEQGAKAIATASWAIAACHGFDDGENLPFALALDNLRRIVAVTDLPVSFDLEAGYGKTPEQVAKTVAMAIEAGAIGFNLEDQEIGQSKLFSIDEQQKRIRASRKAANENGFTPFINARCDGFLIADSQTNEIEILDEVIKRSNAYKDAGADGFFVPGLSDPGMIKTLCKQCSLPVNIMLSMDGPDIGQMAQLGVSRISHGPAPYQAAYDILTKMAQSAYSS